VAVLWQAVRNMVERRIGRIFFIGCPIVIARAMYFRPTLAPHCVCCSAGEQSQRR
jgi:hypothetical protein